MTSGTMQKDGLMAGAARPGSCAVRLHPLASIPAPIHAYKWLGSNAVPATQVFATDRPIPRPLERSP